MTPRELLDACDTGDGPRIYLSLPKKSPPRDRVRLAGRRGPLGRVLNVREVEAGYAVTAAFVRAEVKAYLLANM